MPAIKAAGFPYRNSHRPCAGPRCWPSRKPCGWRTTRCGWTAMQVLGSLAPEAPLRSILALGGAPLVQGAPETHQHFAHTSCVAPSFSKPAHQHLRLMRNGKKKTVTATVPNSTTCKSCMRHTSQETNLMTLDVPHPPLASLQCWPATTSPCCHTFSSWRKGRTLCCRQSSTSAWIRLTMLWTTNRWGF